ncbi:MAG: redox-sensing transcriptional repressor Rex, partial [Oscillospiraceae bacterium]
FHLAAIFDNNPAVIGTSISGLEVLDAGEIELFCRENRVDVAILCVPNEVAELTAERLIGCGVTGFWNFTHHDISMGRPGLVVENA